MVPTAENRVKEKKEGFAEKRACEMSLSSRKKKGGTSNQSSLFREKNPRGKSPSYQEKGNKLIYTPSQKTAMGGKRCGGAALCLPTKKGAQGITGRRG